MAAHSLGREVGARGVMSGWRITTTDGAHDRDDDRLDEHVLYLEDAASAEDSPDAALAIAPDGSIRRIWRYPADPALPALAALVFPSAARVVLDRLGVAATITDLRLAAYRPGKRAVVQLTTTGGTIFVKIVPPGSLDGVLARHRAWHDAGMPSPPPVAWSRDGLVVLGALSGRPAVEALADVDPHAFAAAIGEMRGRIAGIPLGLPARTSLGDRLAWYRDRVTGLAPELTSTVARAVQDAAVRRAGAAPRSATVHGDLHLGQLLVDPADPGRLVGILDVDTSGTGDPADDDAALWAHAVVTAEHGGPGAGAFAAALHDGWSAERSVRDRVTGVATALLLGHGLSGHLPLERAVALAAALAARPDENPLTAPS